MKADRVEALAPPEALRTEPRPRCPLCGSEGDTLHAGVRDHFFHCPGSWSLKRCRNAACTLVWQDPMVTADDIGRAYDGYYTSAKPADGAALHEGPSPLGATFNRLDRIASRLLRLDPDRQRHAAAYLDGVAPGRLLDVGCGNGELAARLQRLGWSVRGTDFDPAAAAAAKALHGIEVDVGELAAIGHPDGAFDAVVARHVVEHVRDPVAFVAECWRLVAPGGRLVLVTPNVGSLGHRRFGAHWRGLEQPRHLHLFGVTSLRAALRRAGVARVDAFTTAQGADYLLQASRTAGRGGWRRFADGVAVWSLQVAETLRSRRGEPVGEELVAVAVKDAIQEAGR